MRIYIYKKVFRKLTFSVEPDNYDWVSTRAITIGADSPDGNGDVAGDIEEVEKTSSELEKDKKTSLEQQPVVIEANQDVEATADAEVSDPSLDRAVLQRVFIRAAWFSAALSLIIAILIPIPMFASHYIFSRRFFEVWIR